MAFLVICWGIDAVALLAAIYYFGKALSVSRRLDTPFFIGWLLLILTPYMSISISYWLNIYGYAVVAALVAATPAIPATLYTLLIFLLSYSKSNRRGAGPVW